MIFENWVYPLGPEAILPTGVFALFVPIEGVDESGRSLRESRSVRFKPDPDGFSMLTVGDGRKVRSNVSALHHFLGHKAESYAIVTSVSAEVKNRLPWLYEGESPALGMFGLFVGYTLYKAPLYWLLREWYGVSRDPVPAYVASASKVGEGLVEFLRRNLIAHSDQRINTCKHRAQTIRSSGALLGRTEMCPVSNGLLEEFLSNIEDVNSANQESMGEAQIAHALVDFAFICWQVERIAIEHSYSRLQRISLEQGSERAVQEARITFPYSVTLRDVVAQSIPISNSILATYAMISPHSPVPKVGQKLPQAEERPERKQALKMLATQLGVLIGVDLDHAGEAIEELWSDILGN